MTNPTLDHIGIAVDSLAEGVKFYEALGLELEGVEEVSKQGVKVGFLSVGDPRIELLEPTGPSSPIAKHLERRGPGLHHICVRVEDIRLAMSTLTEKGYRLLSDEPQQGAHGCLVCFVHPKSTGGVLLELSEPPEASHAG
jgi:methylmalonyl-CoA/ethylmalonyl-CoA epimerase